MNQRTTKRLRKTLTIASLADGQTRKSVFRVVKRDWNQTPRNERNALLHARRMAAEIPTVLTRAEKKRVDAMIAGKTVGGKQN